MNGINLQRFSNMKIVELEGKWTEVLREMIINYSFNVCRVCILYFEIYFLNYIFIFIVD